MDRILFDNVAGDGQDVVSFLVQLSIPFRRLHDFAARAVYNASFPPKKSGHSIVEEISHSSNYFVLPMLVINSFDFSLNGPKSSVLFNSSINESRFG